MSIKNEIRALIVKSGWTITDLVKALNERNGTDQSVQNFHNKLSRETLRYKDVLEIAEILGYNIEWVKKE